MFVVDASVVVDLLLGRSAVGFATLVGDADLAAPHLLDAEVLSALRRLAAAGVDDAHLDGCVRTLQRLPVDRWGVAELAPQIWALRHQLSAYDATYVALAEHLGCALVSGDARLGRAHGLPVPVVALPAG